MKKKVLATLLALCMLMSLLPAAAFAADAEESEAMSVEETVSEPVEEPAESEPAEAPAESEPAEETAPAEEPEIDTGIGFGFGPIISIEELKDQGFIPEDYTSEEPAESEDADVETGLAEEPVIQDEDVHDDNDNGDNATATTPAEDAEEPEILVVPLEPVKETEDEETEDEYDIALCSISGEGLGQTTKTEEGKETVITEVIPAPLDDSARDKKTEDQDFHYELTFEKSKAEGEDNVYNVTVEYKGVVEHGKDGSDKPEDQGLWVGVGFIPGTSSEDLTVSYSYVFGGEQKPTGLYGDSDKNKHTGEKIEDAVKEDSKGLAFYADASKITKENPYLWVAIEWKDGTTEYFRIEFKEYVAPVEPEKPEPEPKPEPNVPEVDDSGDSDSTPATPPIETAGDTTTASVTAVSSTNGTTASAELSSSKLDAAISSALTEAAKRGTNPEVKIELRTSEKADSLNVTLPTASLKSLADAKGSSLAVASGVAGVKLDHTALSALASQAAGRTITLVVTPVASYSLTEAQKAAVGKAPVVNLAFLSDGVAIQDYGSGTITVSLAYTPAGGQAASDVAVYYLGDSGSMTPRSTTYHDGQVTFITTHLGRYVIGTAK